MLQTIITVFHVLLAAALIALVLFQRGKGAEAGAAFGAGASGTVFGAKGSSSFLTRTTGVLAALFFVTSLSLAYLGSKRQVPTSVLESASVVEESASDVPDVLPLPVETTELPELPDAEVGTDANGGNENEAPVAEGESQGEG
ncbi:MAG: preprotein translocase subunit SecG [Gammaproteobacteria bacterium]